MEVRNHCLNCPWNLTGQVAFMFAATVCYISCSDFCKHHIEVTFWNGFTKTTRTGPCRAQRGASCAFPMGVKVKAVGMVEPDAPETWTPPCPDLEEVGGRPAGVTSPRHDVRRRSCLEWMQLLYSERHLHPSTRKSV